MQLVDWIREGTPTPVTAEHARHVIDIIESTYRAACTGTAQELTTSFGWVANPGGQAAGQFTVAP